MKSKITKIQILTKGIATFILIILMLSSLSILNVFAAEIDDSIVSSGSGIDDPDVGSDYIGSEDAEYVAGTIIKEIDKLKNQLSELSIKLNDNFKYEDFVTKITNNNTIDISTELELRALSIYVAEGNNCSGKTFRLKNNIVLTDTLEWSPIGDDKNQFRGTIDGGGYSISGMVISIKQSFAGLVGYLGNGGTIKNLTIANSNISIPPEVDNKILNDLLNSQTVSYSYLGAFAGYAINSTITNCKNTTNISGGNIVGGIVGRMKNGSITYCSNSGYIQAYRTAGGIVGSFDVMIANKTAQYKVSRCKNTGSVYAIVANAGGIAGTLRNNGLVNYCLNNGEVSTATATFKVYIKAEESQTITPENAGGIVGVALSDVIEGIVNTTESNVAMPEIAYCLNDVNGKINGYMDIGGIAGQLGRYDIITGIGNSKIVAKMNSCINNAVFKIDDYKNKKNVGELAGRAGVKDAMGALFTKCSYLNYQQKDNVNAHKTTTDKILAFGFNGFIYYNIKDGKYDEGGTFKKTTNEDITKIKDIAGPKFNETIKATIVNHGNSQDFAIKGDVIKIAIPFDEPINVNRIYPKLTLINGRIEADYIGIYENSLVFQYTVTGKEDPLATSPYAIDNLQLTGTMYDIFGNKTSYSSQEISVGEPGNNLKIVNSNSESIKNASVTYSKGKILYTISGFSNITEDGKLYFNKNSTMKVTATLAGKLTHSGNIDENLESDIPKLQVKTNPNSDIFKNIEGTYSTTNYTLTYNVGLSESASVSVEELYLTTQNEIYINGESAGILNQENTKVNVKNIIIDTVAPELTISTFVNNETESGRYTVGEDILIKATTSEAIDLEKSILPEINVSFSESGLGKYNNQGENATTGNAKYMDTIKNEDGSITLKYRYTIQKGDEGKVQLSFASTTGTIQDVAGNTIDVKSQYTDTEISLNENDTNWSSNLGATVELYKNSVNLNNKIINKTYLSGTDDLYFVTTFDKKLYSYKADINGHTYEKEIDKNTAPSLYIPKADGKIKADCTRVIFENNKTIVTYKIEDIASNYRVLTDIKNLKLVNENNKQTIDITGNALPAPKAQAVKYTVEDTLEELKADAIKVVDIENIVIDAMGINEKMQFNVYADTTAPAVEITSDTSNPTNTNIIKYVFKFNEIVEGFTVDDITVNNGIKGEFKEVEKGLKYTLEVQPTITDGNEGIIQVIVEENTCRDLVGYENIRQENNITIDKVKPTFTSYEINKEGSNIIIVAAFSEELSDASGLTPTLKIGEKIPTGSFEDLDTTKEGKQIAQIFDGNKVKYVYNISGADGGKADITLSGTVKDIAGNNSEELNIVIENDIILQKTVIKTSDAEYSFRKNGTNITNFANPTYFKENDKIHVTKVTEELQEDGTTETQNKTYTYTIVPTYENNTHMKYMMLVEPEEGETQGTVTFSINSSANSINITDANIYFDTTKPVITTEVIAKNPKDGLYTTGEELIITATTSEEIKEDFIPEINVKFGEKEGKFNNGKAQNVETKQNENGTRSWIYRYVVSEGDEGEIALSYERQTITDLAKNKTSLDTLNTKEGIFTLNSITIDATAPTVKITAINNVYDFNNDDYVNNDDVVLLQEYLVDDCTDNQIEENIKQNGDVDKNGEINQIDVTYLNKLLEASINTSVTNAEQLHCIFTWSEEVTEFSSDNITVNGGRKGALSSGVQNEDGTYSYTMDITTNVENGNTGDIQVIVEQNAVQDLVGHGNVRTESVISIDKQAPILISMEAYATSIINVNEDVDSVKEYYKVGDTVTIISTFSENIESTTTVPTLALQFSESGNAKGTVSNGTKSGNKITYTYTIAEKDMGTLSVKGFSGIVIDAAGNETIVTKRTLDGDTIIADTQAPTLIGITAIAPNFEYDELLEEPEDSKRHGVASKTRENNIITVIAEYSENIYKLQSNTVNNITSDTAPVLNLRFGTGTVRTATFSKVEGTKLYYTYNITSGDNGGLNITRLSGTVSDIAGNICTTGTSLPTLSEYEGSIAEENKFKDGKHIVADTTAPAITLEAEAVDKDDNGNTISDNGNDYRKGSIITVTATANEYVYKNDEKALTKFTKEDMPDISLEFGNVAAKGNVTKDSVKYEENKTTFTYTYTVTKNDNGELTVSIGEDSGYDIALNGNSEETQSIPTIIADTVNPVTNWQSWVESEGYGIVDNENGTWTVTFSEKLYVYNPNTHTVGSSVSSSTAPILLVSHDNTTPLETTVSNITTKDGKTVITYSYSPYTKNIGAFGMKFANVSDRAGNLFNYKDQVAPTLSSIKVTDPATGTYKAGEEITIVARFDEKITGTAPTLALKFGTEAAKGTVRTETGFGEDGKTITYKYTITAEDNGDNGVLGIVSYTGTGLKDLSDNLWVAPENVTLTGNRITADTIAPKVTITADVEKTNADKVTYTFKWSEKVIGFTVDDIEVTNGSKGELKATDEDSNGYATTYTLEVDTTNEGRQIIKVPAKACKDIAGNLNEERGTYNQVVIDLTKPTVRAKVNGGSYVLDNIDPEYRKSILKETLVVNEEVSKFEYIWSKETTIPTEGFTTISPDDIQINSDIKLEKQVEETGTYYLYMKVTDKAGNTFVGKTNGFVVRNSNITLIPSTTAATNKDVTVTVSYGDGLTQNQKAGMQGKTQSADSTMVIVSENGTVYAEATDIAGNMVFATLEIENIDKTAPTVKEIKYTTNADGSVKATIEFDEDNVTMLNPEGKNEYTFTENGEFTFEFADSLGNKGTATAKVSNIEKTEPEKPTPPVEEDKTAPEITFNYTTTTATVGTTIGATITSNEDAIISYSWDNKKWTSSSDYIRSVNATKTPRAAGTYTLYAKATDKSSNTSSVSTLQFTIVKSEEEIENPEIIFEDLTTIQKNGVKYVKVSPTYTTTMLTAKMDKEALLGKTPEYTKLTSNNKLKTGSEIRINGVTKYIVIVNGDVNCDGKVDFLNDIVMINNHRIGINKNLKDIQILAGDINNSGTIEFIPDIVAMNNYRLGRINVL